MILKFAQLLFGGPVKNSLNGFEFASYTKVEDLIEDLDFSTIVCVDGALADRKGNEEILLALKKLRQAKYGYITPVFFADSLNNLNLFVDGAEMSAEEMLRKGSRIYTNLKGINLGKNCEETDLRLLTFFYSRGQSYRALPKLFPHTDAIYEYPEISLLLQSNLTIDLVSNASWELQSKEKENNGGSSLLKMLSLTSQGLIEKGKLIERIRLCPHCQSGYLNYIDRCTLCGSIDFEKRKMIHCFTCSHIAPQEEFKEGMRLACPKCNSILRHIGTDYDRPVESYLCNSCNERFIEPEVYAECLNCRKKSLPENLIVRQIYEYRLSEKGERAVKMGQINFKIELFDEQQNMLMPYFCHISDWLLKMRQRYLDAEFSLIYLNIKGIKAIEENAGRECLVNIMQELADRIRSMVRFTDLTTNSSEDTFWILLPRTSAQGGDILAARLMELEKLIMIDEKSIARIECHSVQIPKEYVGKENATMLFINQYEAARREKESK